MVEPQRSTTDRIIILEVAVKGLDKQIVDLLASDHGERVNISEALKKNLTDHERIMTAINAITVAQGITIERLSTVTKVMWMFLGAGIASFVAVVVDMVSK